VYLLVLAALLVASYILSKTKFSSSTSTDVMEQWKQQIFDRSQYGETFIRFIITLIIAAGALIKVVYNSYGMASLPIFLIRGQRSLEDER
jgi:Fe2+ transport system protein B